jgi:hypothetical protein
MSTENNPLSASPYAPPRAVVADADRSLVPRPATIELLVKLLWIDYVLSVVLMGWSILKPDPELQKMDMAARTIGLVFGLAFCGLILALSAWINFAIGKGRNWARIAYLVLTLMWIPLIPYLYTTTRAGTTSIPEALLNLVGLVMSLVICYLLLARPAREWFVAMKERNVS